MEYILKLTWHWLRVFAPSWWIRSPVQIPGALQMFSEQPASPLRCPVITRCE